MDPNKPTRKMRFIPKLPSHKRTPLSSDQSTSSEDEAEGRVDAQGSSRGSSRDVRFFGSLCATIVWVDSNLG
ncbi:hypothetical protein AKJ16_DCAP22713 [Drosera capensis]